MRGILALIVWRQKIRWMWIASWADGVQRLRDCHAHKKLEGEIIIGVCRPRFMRIKSVSVGSEIK